jgi:MoaA/NifB/PqqE/SkfB family radical SAM enzyme
LLERIQSLVAGDADLAGRLLRLRAFGRRIRVAEYHLTNACNLRCRGCWFFAYDFDAKTREARAPASWRAFASEQAARGTTAALLIGGEPTLFPERVAAFVEAMEFVTVSSNGLRGLPRAGFESVAVALTLFGGGVADDELRAIRPSGRRFTGLFETALAHYRNDPRAHFIYALAPDGSDLIEDTVKRILDNGNCLTFNYYAAYGDRERRTVADEERRLLDHALRMRDTYPETVTCHPEFIRTLITGRSGELPWGYDVCPSVSRSHPANKERFGNGQPALPGFEVWGADQETIQLCCASAACGECRDSQAIYSWMMVSLGRFLDSRDSLVTWVEIAESYWRQFVWSPWRDPANGGVLQ